jgi:aerotaxis receptor
MRVIDDGNFLIESEVPENEVIISRTDLKGIITYANETFCKISGYESSELVGRSHNILRHPDMPKSAFKEMWESIKSARAWSGYVKNMTKQGGFYWVYAEVSCVIKDGRIVEYKSMRSRVDRDMKQKMQLEYDRLREKQEGIKRVCIYLSEDELAKIV